MPRRRAILSGISGTFARRRRSRNNRRKQQTIRRLMVEAGSASMSRPSSSRKSTRFLPFSYSRIVRWRGEIWTSLLDHLAHFCEALVFAPVYGTGSSKAALIYLLYLRDGEREKKVAPKTSFGQAYLRFSLCSDEQIYSSCLPVDYWSFESENCSLLGIDLGSEWRVDASISALFFLRLNE